MCDPPIIETMAILKWDKYKYLYKKLETKTHDNIRTVKKVLDNAVNKKYIQYHSLILESLDKYKYLYKKVANKSCNNICTIKQVL